MFLASKEIKRDKLRYSLIAGMIALLSYLMLVLSGLALGLANQNTSAINNWGATHILLSKDADGQLRSSALTGTQLEAAKTNGKTATLSYTTTKLEKNGGGDSVNFLGIPPESFVAKNVPLTAGNMFTQRHEIVVDQGFAKIHSLKVGDSVTLGTDKHSYKITGLAADAKLSVMPVVYGNQLDWNSIRPQAPTIKASAIIATAHFTEVPEGAAQLSISDFVNKLPGYSAQNDTFTFMIIVLELVALIIIAVFLYIIVLQKLPNIAVLKAQGIPASFLVRSTIAQALLVVGAGLSVAILLTIATAFAIPPTMPMQFWLPLQGGISLGMLVMAVLGALIPARKIWRADPLELIG